MIAASINRIKASDDSAPASVATVQSTRIAPATTIVVDTVAGWPAYFVATMGTPHTFTDPVTSEEITVISEATAKDFAGHVDAGNLVIDSMAPGFTDTGSAVGDVIILKPTTAWADNIARTLAVSHEDTGALKAQAIRDALNIDPGSLTGWAPLGYTPNTVTNNGNRSYDLVVNSVDLTSSLSVGMKLRLTRTVTAPIQCASLNGTNHYFNKTSPAGTTFTDDFAASAWVKLTSYAQGTIISRYNGTSGWYLDVNSNGQVRLVGHNAGGANFSLVSSNQSIPLNKWVHITAQLDMSAFTATTTTSYIMIDGVDVPATVSRNGTNPTALVQAGNLEVGSANASQFFPGKIAQAFYTSAKLTQANARILMTRGIANADGATYSIVSAYSFNNAITDIITGTANNLTAQNSAAATNSDSPFALSSSGVPSGTTEYALITKIAFSTNTTITVQTPEGGALPATGGISAVSYSTHRAPYGFPTDGGVWDVIAFYKTAISGSASLNTWGGSGKGMITMPVGPWDIEYDVPHYSDYGTGSNTSRIHYLTLSTTNNTETDSYWTSIAQVQAAATNPIFGSQQTKRGAKSLSAQTPLYVVFKESGSGGISNHGIFMDTSGANASGFIKARPACL